MTATAIGPGVYPDLSFADYLAHPFWGSSSIKQFRNGTPAAAKWGRENDSGDTAATILGTAAHCKIITPSDYGNQIAIKPPGMTFQGKANKAIRDAWHAEGKKILSHEDGLTIDAIVQAFERKSAARQSLENSVGREQSVFWRCAESGLGRKCRPDWYDADTIYDLKISIEATKPFDRLQMCAHANGWLNQLAGGRAGLNANGHNIRKGALVVIASQPPHDARVWLLRLKEEDCDFLELENENTCRQVAECERKDRWPGTPEQWQDITLPSSATWTELDIEDLEEAL